MFNGKVPLNNGLKNVFFSIFNVEGPFEISAKNLLKMHGWVKISRLKCIGKHKKKLTPISPNRIAPNFDDLLVFVSSFMDNYRANEDFGRRWILKSGVWEWWLPSHPLCSAWPSHKIHVFLQGPCLRSSWEDDTPHYRPPIFIHTFITCLALFTGKELFNDWLQLGAEVIAMEPALKKNLCAPINKIPEHDDDDNVGHHNNDDNL